MEKEHPYLNLCSPFVTWFISFKIITMKRKATEKEGKSRRVIRIVLKRNHVTRKWRLMTLFSLFKD